MDYRLVEASPGIRAVLLPNSPEFTIVTVSDDYVSATGLPRELLKGHGFFEPLPGSSGPKDLTGEHGIRAALQSVLQHKAAHLEARQRFDTPNPDGTFTQRYWKTHTVPVLDDAGSISYIIYTAEEITTKVSSEEQENQVEANKQAYDLFMQAPVAVCIVSGAEHRVELANEQMLQLLGRTKEMVGKPIHHTLTEAKDQGLIDVLNFVYATGKPYHAPSFPGELMINGEREKRYFDLVFQPYHQNPDSQQPTGIFCTAYNITQLITSQKRLEESAQELQLAIDAAELGTFRLDLRTNKATNSEKVNEWFGYTQQGYSREEGFNPIHPDDRSYVDEVILSTLQSEASSQHDVTYRVVHPRTGAIRHLRSFGKTMFDEPGKPYLIIGIIQDVTAQMLHQQELEESEALLQQRVLERTLELEKLNQELHLSNKNLEEFAYAASHDMKEPIRKIQYFSDRLKARLSNKLAEEDVRHFARMEAAAQRMSTLIDDLLTYSDISRGISHEDVVDLNATLQLVKEDLELIIAEKKAQVLISPLPTIKGHKRQLQQLFENLVSNALKYSKPDASPEISITSNLVKGSNTKFPVSAEAANKSFHLIEVRDNGIGFEQADAERIFNVFTRLHGIGEYKGTGVGLSIVRKVAHNHQGYVWAESTPGSGTTFCVLLPAYQS